MTEIDYGNATVDTDDASPPAQRSVSLNPLTAQADDVPTWVWAYGGKGRIAAGSLALFAGRPGAGKSTAARWFVAEATNGRLAGEWSGIPVNVAYIAAEESAKYVVKPGMRAAGADLSRILTPKVSFGGDEVRFLSSRDMADLTVLLIQHDVRLVVVDPLMSTIGGKTDINRNNEVRELIEPWAKLAEAIDGIVLGVVHLNKSSNGDIVAGINGSSAFGEVARATFGFAKDPESEDGLRIMSQAKNSIGEEDLALEYRIESTTVTTDSGRSADVGRFVIVGTSQRTVSDVLRTGPADVSDRAASNQAEAWLLQLLLDGKPMESNEVYSSAESAGFSKDKAKKAKAKINDPTERIRAYKTADGWFWQRVDRTTVLDGDDETKGADSASHARRPVESAPLLPSRSEAINTPSVETKGARVQECARSEEARSCAESDRCAACNDVMPDHAEGLFPTDAIGGLCPPCTAATGYIERTVTKLSAGRLSDLQKACSSSDGSRDKLRHALVFAVMSGRIDTTTVDGKHIYTLPEQSASVRTPGRRAGQWLASGEPVRRPAS